MSEWLKFKVKWKFFSSHMMMTTSYISMRLWCFSLWNSIPQIDMSLHCDASSRFRTNQSLLHNMVCLVEMKQISILVFVLTRPGLEPTIHCPRGDDTNNYTTDAVWRWLIYNYSNPLNFLYQPLSRTYNTVEVIWHSVVNLPCLSKISTTSPVHSSIIVFNTLLYSLFSSN